MAQPNFHLELRTQDGKYLTDFPLPSRDRGASVLRTLARVSPGTYGPNGSHRLVLTGPDHQVMPRTVETVAGV